MRPSTTPVCAWLARRNARVETGTEARLERVGRFRVDFLTAVNRHMMVLHGKKWVELGQHSTRKPTAKGVAQLHDEPMRHKKRNESEVYERLRQRPASAGEAAGGGKGKEGGGSGEAAAGKEGEGGGVG